MTRFAYVKGVLLVTHKFSICTLHNHNIIYRFI